MSRDNSFEVSLWKQLIKYPPGEISDMKNEYLVDVAQYTVKGSKLWHIHKKAAKEYPRALGQNVSKRWYS